MITVVDPTPPSNPAGAILVFQQSSMTNTRLYAPGADPKTDAAYVVTASPDVRQVALRRGPQGDGPVLATVAYAGAFARARGRLGTVAFAGRDAKTPIEEWLATSKGTPKKDVRIALSVGGTDCVWTVHVQDGAHGICDVRVAWFVRENWVLTVVPSCLALARGRGRGVVCAVSQQRA